MRVRLTRDTRIMAHAGDAVEVSPDEGTYLVSVGLAEAIVDDEPPTAEAPAEEPKEAKAEPKKPAKKTAK